MKYLLTLLLLLGSAFGQNVRYDNVALGPKGPIPNATVAVCTQPAVTTTAPCSPTANLCSSLSDTTCTSANPLTSDSLGNFHFYVQPAQVPFTVQIYGSNVISPYVLTDQGQNQGTAPFSSTNPNANITSIVAYEGTGTPASTGVFTGLGVATLGSVTSIQQTATVGAGVAYSASASASTSTVIGVKFGESGNNSLGPISAFYTWVNKFQAGNSTNVRYWMGLGDWTSSGGTGNNGLAILGTTAYASNTPNKSTIGFRYSAGTDTSWQAVICTAGGSQTTVSTGVPLDFNIHLFQITPNSAGTSFTFSIDNVSVATISTNIPPTGNGGNSVMTAFWTGDNENTATVISANFYWMQWAMK